jgi:hypothetical protein
MRRVMPGPCKANERVIASFIFANKIKQEGLCYVSSQFRDYIMHSAPRVEKVTGFLFVFVDSQSPAM